MTTSQSDVDKVMAAFGAVPMNYRPHQDAAAGFNAPAAAAPAAAPGTTYQEAPPATPSARAAERILPGAGGPVREIFPLLSRAVPVVGDLKVGAIKRVGDEVPEPQEPETGMPSAPAEAPPPPPQAAPGVTGETSPTPIRAAETMARSAAQPWPFRPVPRGEPAAEEQSPAQWDQQPPVAARAAPPPEAVAALPAQPLPLLRSHADLIRAIGPRAPSRPLGPAVTPPNTAMPAVHQPAVPQPSTAQPPVALPVPPPHYPAAGFPPPPPPPPPQGYPPFYPPQAMPPPAMQPYPIHPGAAGWPHPGYALPYPPPYPPPPAGYSPGYPPGYPPAYPPAYPPNYPAAYPPAYPAAYPYGYPQPLPPVPPQGDAPVYPPGYGVPADSPPPQEQEVAPPPPPAAPPPPASLSDIFAALHRAPGSDRGEETP